MKRWISVTLVAAISTVVYLNSLDGGFVFDDHRAILTNDDLDWQKSSVWELFLHDFWGGTMWRKESHKSYRPLTVLTYRYFNYYFAGLNPYSYHLVNIILHGLATVLFLIVAETVLSGAASSEWPLFAALLFATHSIHTESVSSVVGRAELVSAIFYFLSFIIYVQAVSRTGLSINWIKIILSVFLAACSMLSKEPGITVLGVCIGYDILCHWLVIQGLTKSYDTLQNGSVTITEKYTGGSTVKDSVLLSKMSKRIGVLIVAGLLLMWFRFSMNYGSEPIFKPEEMRAAFDPDRAVRIMSFSNIYSWNIWLLLAPSPLCCDWSLGSIPLVQNISDIRNLYSLALYAGIVILSLHTLRSNSDRITVGVSLSFLIVPFFPSTGILLRVGFVIAERVLYLPSSGACLLVTFGFSKISQYFKNTRVVQFPLAYLILVMSIKTISRNPDWRSDLFLFESGARVNPNNVKMLNNYGMELKSANRMEESKQQYLKAIEVEPDYAEIYFNYGNLLSEMNDYQGAAENFEKAISYPQMYSKTLNNLATTYFRLGRLRDAEKTFMESLELNPDQPMTYNNLASLYGESDRFEESEKMFKKSIALNPNYVEAYFNLGTLLYKMGKEEEAVENLKYALKLNPAHSGALNNLKVIQYYRDKQQQQQRQTTRL